MTLLKSKIATFFKSKKINVLVVFISLALLFSLLTKLSKDYTKTISFDVDMINVPDEHVIINDSLHNIEVTLSTYGFNLLKYYFVDPKLKVDFNHLKTYKSNYVWTKNDQFQNVVDQFNMNTTINNISPDTINFFYDSYFVKTVPIVLKEEINFVPGFDVDENYTIQPDSVNVIGGKLAVDSIAYVETNVLTINDVNSNISSSITLNLPGNYPNIKFATNEVLVKGKVKKFTEGSLLIPVFITNLPKDTTINYFPKEIEVTFYTSLESFKSITINDFRIECDFSNVNTDNGDLIPKLIKQPINARNVKITTKLIEFILL